MTPGTEVDLSGDTALTAKLIAQPLEWRVRVVERVEVDRATSCVRRRSLQSVPLRPVLPAHAAEATRDALAAFVVLPVVSLPRGALLNFDVSGPEDKPAFLLPRTEIARREAEYLCAAALAAGLAPIGPDLRQLLEAVLAYTGPRTPADPRLGGRIYLEDGFGQELPHDVLDRWLEIDAQIADCLAPFAEAQPELSPTEHPFLGLPLMASALDTTLTTWHSRVDAVLRDYFALLKAASRAVNQKQRTAEIFLDSLGDYGRNYDLLVATTVPLDRPFMIKYSERRPVSWRGNEGSQDLVISDAATNHFLVVIDDPNVRITLVRAGAAGRDAFGAFTTQETDQTYAVYAYGEDRDYKITLRFTLAPLRRLQFVIYATAGLLVLLAAAVAAEHPAHLRDVALIVGPSALAASVLLTREPSTLGSHLRRRSTGVLAVALLLLLLAAVASYLWPRLPAIWTGVRAVLSLGSSMLR